MKDIKYFAISYQVGRNLPQTVELTPDGMRDILAKFPDILEYIRANPGTKFKRFYSSARLENTEPSTDIIQ